MAEPQRQSWRVPQRIPTLAAIGTVGLLIAVLVIAGTVYNRHLAPQRQQPVERFPAPGIETSVHDGQGDPHRPQQIRRTDPAIAAAKRAVIAEGLPGWPR